MATKFIKHYLVPLTAIIGGPLFTHYLANYSSVDGLEGFQWQMLVGNPFSWLLVGSWIVWCSGFLMIPFDKYQSLTTVFGYSPIYTDNCAPLLIASLICYLTFHSMWPRMSIAIHQNFPYIVGSLNLVGLALSLYLWYRSRPTQAVGLERTPAVPAPPPPPISEAQRRAEMAEAKLPDVYKFCRGTELHPRLLDFDIKQWATMRMGMMGWAVLLLSFSIGSYHVDGYSAALMVNVILQLFYLFKFTEWETSYLSTMDITYGRTGFYLCWGSIALVPCLNTYSTYYMITHGPEISYLRSLATLIVGILIIGLRYQIEYQKDLFKETNGECKIWGRKVTYVEAEYQSANGPKKYRLLTSGFWGMARHLNYVFDVLSALVWCSLSFTTDSIHPYLYPLFLVLLYVHRVYENDNRCLKKYGKDWVKYCEVNKYKMIPYIF